MTKKSIKVACVQFSAGLDVRENVVRALKLLTWACQKGANLVCLPEAFHFRGSARIVPSVATTIPGPITKVFQDFARTKKVCVLLGSVFEKHSMRSKKCFNTSILIGPQGRIIGVYRKKNLFEIRRGNLRVKEAKDIIRGNRNIVAKVFGIRVGLAICYDVRFPEFLGKLIEKGAEILLIPSNFVYETGKAHWEVLCRARAVENLCYVVAPNQGGKNPHTGLRAFGHSLIVDPWGKILARGSGASSEQVVFATLDLTYLKRIRREFPVLSKRFSS